MISITNLLLGKLNDKEVKKYILKNDSGFEVHILNLGGIINKLYTKDKKGNIQNVVLGYDFFEKYIEDPSYAGAIIGPTAGRIEEGKYRIDSIDLVLEINSGEHANHGGIEGLNSKVFDVKEITYKEFKGIELEYKWPHLQGNHYGNMNFYIRYLINENSELHLEMFTESDRLSHVNLTNHSYFNLSGNLNILGDEQFININADRYCAVKSNMIPTGEKVKVDNTCFDLREFRKIKDGLKLSDPQFEYTLGYDHGFILNEEGDVKASLYSENSGIKLDILTTQKVMVMYSGNFLDEAKTFDGIDKNQKFMGIALEAQNYQNGINTEGFDYNIIKPNKPYFEKIIYKFSVI